MKDPQAAGKEFLFFFFLIFKDFFVWKQDLRCAYYLFWILLNVIK